MPEEILTVTVDKFMFAIPADRYYSDAGVWLKIDGLGARLGVSDFVQQSSGDVAFAKVKAAGTKLRPGQEFAEVETVKVNVSIPSPVHGSIVEINPALEEASELINQDPYENGWLAIIELADWENDRASLLSPDAYVALVRQQAEAEMKK